MARIAIGTRQQVYERARGQCEYCQTQQKLVVNMQIDHILPMASGGESALDNLCLSCVGCNSSKREFQIGLDPTTGLDVSLFNPRRQSWASHFRWSDDGLLIIGLTATGRATVNRLKMNRPAIVVARREWATMGKHPPLLDS